MRKFQRFVGKGRDQKFGVVLGYTVSQELACEKTDKEREGAYYIVLQTTWKKLTSTKLSKSPQRISVFDHMRKPLL